MIRRALHEFVAFGLKQAYACIFGGTLLAAILITHYWYPLEGIARYDFLFLFAVGVQAMLLATRMESWQEAGVIIVFHILATAMEVFKTSDAIRSWRYPGEFVFGIGNVPLFAGFMYSAVGSYMARVWRIHDFRFSNYPSELATFVVAGFIYVNFFTHHYFWDLRWVLFAAIAWLYRRTWVHFRVLEPYRRMPLLLGFVLVALFLWIAENISTWSRIWLYPHQADGWLMVPFSKMGSWFLLMILSFVLVAALHRPRPPDASPAR